MGLKDYFKKKQREPTERQRTELEDSKIIDDLLEKFFIADFDEYFKKVLRERPDGKYEFDERLNRDVQKNPSRKKYLEFIHDKINSGEISFEQIKEFSIQRNLVKPSFFETETDIVADIADFKSIINLIREKFYPEKIRNEQHLEARLSLFLKTTFPDIKVERQVTSKKGDILDILMDNKYVFVLKVPKTRTVLRDLSAQIEEYVEQFPDLCVVIADRSGQELSDGRILDVTQDIKEYASKYKLKFKVETLILDSKTTRK